MALVVRSKAVNDEHANGNGSTNGKGHGRSESDTGQTSGAIEQVIAL